MLQVANTIDGFTEAQFQELGIVAQTAAAQRGSEIIEEADLAQAIKQLAASSLLQPDSQVPQ